MRRAGRLARGGPAFADGISAGTGLGVFFECGLALGKILVIFIVNFDGAYFGALATARAFGNINVSGFLADMGRKISRFTV